MKYMVILFRPICGTIYALFECWKSKMDAIRLNKVLEAISATAPNYDLARIDSALKTLGLSSREVLLIIGDPSYFSILIQSIKEKDEPKTLQAIEKEVLAEQVSDDQFLPCGFSQKKQINTYLHLKALLFLGNMLEETGEPALSAYKLTILFPNYDDAYHYLSTFSQAKKPINEASSFQLPQSAYSLSIWRELAKKHMPKREFRNLLQFADKIEACHALANAMTLPPKNTQEKTFITSLDLYAKLQVKKKIRFKEKTLCAMHTQVSSVPKQKPASSSTPSVLEAKLATFRDKQAAHIKTMEKAIISSTLAPPLLKDCTPEQLLKYASLSAYSRRNEDMEAVQILLPLGVSEAHFNEQLDFFQKTPPKPSDLLLPNIFIDGKKVGFKGYYIRKLSDDDPRALFLGLLTACCQHLGSYVGGQCARFGTREPNSCFYIIVKGPVPTNTPLESTRLIPNKQIVAQAWTWRDADTVVFDSIESHTQNISPHIKFNLFNLLARELTKATKHDLTPIKQIHSGGRFATVGYEKVEARRLTYHHSNKTYYGYSDARNQAMFFDAANPIDAYAYFHPLGCLKDIQSRKITPSSLEHERIAFLFLKQAFDKKPLLNNTTQSEALVSLINYAKIHASWITLATFIPLICFKMIKEKESPLEGKMLVAVARQFFDNLLEQPSLTTDYLPLLQYASSYCEPSYITTYQSTLNASPIDAAIKNNNIALLTTFLKIRKLTALELGKLLFLSIPVIASTATLLDFMSTDIKKSSIKTPHFLDRTALHKAIQHTAILSLLLKQFSSDTERLTALKSKDMLGATPFHDAVEHPDSTHAILTSFESHQAKKQAVLLENTKGESILDLSANHPKTLEVILSQFESDTIRQALLQSASLEVKTACEQTQFAYLKPLLIKAQSTTATEVQPHTFFKKEKVETKARFKVTTYPSS
jgi:hypothetical protein